MLSRFVRIQLVIFTMASVIGVLVMVFNYMQVPTLLGIGKITVTLELPRGGGLYRFSNVTYRGLQVGKVTDVAVTPQGAKAILSLDTAPKIPSDLKAEVRSVSAVGEQYVELAPRTDSPPFLHDGSVISARETTLPQQVGPMLDRVSALVNSIPKDQLGNLLDESFKGFNGAGYDLGSLLDSSAEVVGDINRVADRTRTLIDDSAPLLDSQAETTDAIGVWTRSLAAVSDQVVRDDTPVRTLLQKGPGFAQESTRLLDQLKPTLPVLLANLSTIGQIGVTYNASLEQLLVLAPPWVASLEAAAPARNPTGLTLGDFKFSVGDPNPCTVGYLPPSQWRSPADTSTIDTPDGLYCKLPQDSPLSVRGARNYPCMGHPGKRAPTVAICDSDKPYEPLAMRQHLTGPYPVDPNLMSQGVPPDDRVNFGDNIFGPVEGTPMPPGQAPPAAPPPAAPPPDGAGPEQSPAPGVAPPPPAPTEAPPDAAPPDQQSPPAAAPSSFSGGGPGASASGAVVQYDPQTGKYMAPDGTVYQQSDLVNPGAPKSWKDLLLNTTQPSN
jgi:phospholipid/cholesterol/gamma-HCH transport system substrate-binding protein